MLKNVSACMFVNVSVHVVVCLCPLGGMHVFCRCVHFFVSVYVRGGLAGLLFDVSVRLQ